MIRRITTAIGVIVSIVFATNALAAVGRTAGQFVVSPVGSAQYTIPIWTPPGVRGVQPALALTYDSRLGYGLLGPGWTLNGLSAISRCNRTFAQDGAAAAITLTTADAFCLDGNRLRLTSSDNLSTYGQAGTTYQTEIANFANVTASTTLAGNGPASFTVDGKDGLIYSYGLTTDSRIIPPGSSTPYIWALDHVFDRNGNNMSFTYYQVGGAYVPLSIQYTAANGSTNFPYQVNFAYTTKSANDAISKYTAGSQIQQTEQLSTITVTSNGTTVRKYILLYTTSPVTLRATLTSIQECGGSAGTDCLPPTNVGYQNGILGVASPTVASGSGPTTGNVYSVDIDGDGKQDLVFATTSGSNNTWWIQLATATGYTAPISTGAITSIYSRILLDDFDGSGKTILLVPNGGYWYAYRWANGAFLATNTGTPVVAGAGFVSADVQGDGLPDIVVLYGTGGVSIQTNTASSGVLGFSAPVLTSLTLPRNSAVYGNNDFAASSIKHMDFDGDGKEDLVVTVTTQSRQPPSYSTSVYALLSRGTDYVLGPGTILSGVVSPVPVLPVRWNDDSCTDLQIAGSVLIAACNGLYGQTISLGSVTPSIALDWDGDGRTDLLANVGGTWKVYRSEGNAVAPAITAGIAIGTGTYLVTDQNGDGLSDIAIANSTTGYSISFGLHNGTGQPPDKLTSIKDGYANSISPSYASIAQSNYTVGTDAAFPYQNYIGPLYVVSSVVYSDPSNMPSGTYSQQFNYTDAWNHVQGRGLQGFSSISKTDSRYSSPLRTESVSYDLAFPYTQMIVDNKLVIGGVTIAETAGTPAMNELHTVLHNERHFPYIASEVINQKDLGGSALTYATTTYSYDNYGNQTSYGWTGQDLDPGSPHLNDTWSVSVANTFDVDGANQSADLTAWCLPLLNSTVTTYTSSAVGFTPVTRTKTFVPDTVAQNCRIAHAITEPNSSLYKVTEDFNYDTSVGNLMTHSVTGTGMTTRSTFIGWDTAGHFPTSITNALNQSITQSFDPNTGMMTSQSDPNSTTGNPLTTTWLYDNFARKTKESRPDGTSTTWSYNNCATAGCVNSNNQMTVTETITNFGGGTQRVTNTYLDSINRPLVTSSTMINGAFDRNEVQYYPTGLLKQRGAPGTIGAPTAYWTTYGYDALDRVSQIQRPFSATDSTPQTTGITYTGRTTAVKDPRTNVTSTIALLTGAVARSIDAKGYYLDYVYDAAGALQSVKDSATPSHALFSATYAYGVDEFQTYAWDVDGGGRTYTVDALGEITKYTDANSQSFLFTYDYLSRPLVRTEPDVPSGSVVTTWTWGNSSANYNIGRLQSVGIASSAGTYSESYVYDSTTRLSSKVITIPGDASYTYSYGYDSATGLPSTLTYPVSTSSYQFKLQYGYTNGLLASIKDAGTGTIYWAANTTNPRGQVTQETLGNGVITNRSFDAVTGWINAITAGAGGGSGLQNFAYMFDAMGNVTQRQNNNILNNNSALTENFYYDADYRLDHSTLNGSINLQMTYDTTGMGNILSRSDVANGTSWTYDSSRIHAVTQAGTGGYSYTYDSNGNTLTRNGYNLTWASYNYPLAIATNGESVTFQYGPDRQRWKTQYSGPIGTETTFHVGGLLEKVTNGSAADYRHYIYAGDELVGVYSRQNTGTNTLHYVLEDHQGSFASILTGSSPATNYVNESFDAYGSRRNAATWTGPPPSQDETNINGVSRQGYTGETVLGVSMGLNHLNGRVEDSISGRFLSPDPAVPDPANTQSFNRYSYVNNNPLSVVDPTGFDDEPPLDPIVVTGTPDPGSAGGDFGGLGGGFGGGLSPYQLQLLNAGLLGVSEILGLPAQASDGVTFGTETIDSTRGIYVKGPRPEEVYTTNADGTHSPATILPDSRDQISPVTVEADRYYWLFGNAAFGRCPTCPTNISPLFGGIERYDVLNVGVETIELSINGALLATTGFNLYSAGRGLYEVFSAAMGPVGLAERAAQIHGALDPIAQGMRTTAALETNAGRIIGGGGRDLIPAQRALLGPGEIAAQAPGADAEITVLAQAARMGATPFALAVTRTICPSCAAAIRASGGVLTTPTTAIWPLR